MSERSRELPFVLIGLALIVAGIGFDAVASGVEEPRDAPADGRVSARAVFCPPTSADPGSEVRISASAGTEEGAELGIEPDAPRPAELAPGTSVAAKVAGGEPSEVVGYGEPVAAGGLVSARGPIVGAGATGCASAAATEWFFAAGSSALDSDQRILLYNPFPDEAVVRLNLYTPKGLETKTSLQDIPVEARGWTDVEINQAIRVRGVVGTRVVAKRGRVVAWREMFVKSGDKPRSVQLSLGVPATSETWYFADGALGPGVDERLSLLNPEGREAIVSVTVTTSKETLQPQKLLEYPVPRRSAVTLALEDFIKEPKEFTGASIAVKSVNGVRVAAERTAYYAIENGVSGGASEPGAPAARAAWLLPAAAATPEDDAVALTNPTSETVTVDIMILGEGSSRSPDGLQGIELAPGRRRKVSVQGYNRGRPLAVLATGSGPFVAERYAYSPSDEDVAVVLGIPLP